MESQRKNKRNNKHEKCELIMTYLQRQNPDRICRLILQLAGELGEMNRPGPSALHAWEMESGKEGGRKKDRVKVSTYYFF